MIAAFWGLLFLIILFNAKSGKLTIEKSNVLKAFFPYFIILHHVSQITGGVLDFRWAGPYGVGIFFFISGYGLEYKRTNGVLTLTSYMTRVKRILCPLIIPIAFYLIILSANGTNVRDYLITQVHNYAIVFPYTWFVITLLILYTSFYILSSFNPKNLFLALFAFLVLFSAIMIFLKMDGTYYITTYCFLAGAVYHNREEFVQRWQIFSPFTITAMGVLLITTIIALFPPHI